VNYYGLVSGIACLNIEEMQGSITVMVVTKLVDFTG
jgi:hypothetical protein